MIGLDGIEEPKRESTVPVRTNPRPEAATWSGTVEQALGAALGAVDLSNPVEVGEALAVVESIDREVYAAKSRLKRALIDYSVERGERTFLVDGVGKFVRDGGPASETQYDSGLLERGLREAGMPDDRIREIVVREWVVKVSGVEAQKAARSNPAYAKAVEAATRKVDRPFGLRRGK